MSTRTLLCAAFVLLLKVAGGQVIELGKPNPLTGQWQIFQMPGYSFQYPDTFDLDTTGYSGTSFMLFSKKTSEQDPFRENITLLIQDVGDTISLDRYAEIARAQVGTIITSGKVLESKRLMQDGMPYHRLVFSGRQGEFNLKWKQYYWIRKKKAWVITLTCEESQYGRFSVIADQLVSTFHFH